MTGHRVIAKSHVFEKNQSTSAVRKECRNRAGSVTKNAAWLSEAFKSENEDAAGKPAEIIPADRLSNAFGKHPKRTSYLSSSTPATVQVAGKEVSGESKSAETIPAAMIPNAFAKQPDKTSYPLPSTRARLQVAGKKVSGESKLAKAIPAKAAESKMPPKGNQMERSEPVETMSATDADDGNLMRGGRPGERAGATNANEAKISAVGKMSVADRARWLSGAFKK